MSPVKVIQVIQDFAPKALLQSQGSCPFLLRVAASLAGLLHRILNFAEFTGAFHHFKEALPAALEFP